jgi:hypothetical protein
MSNYKFFKKIQLEFSQVLSFLSNDLKLFVIENYLIYKYLKKCEFSVFQMVSNQYNKIK